MYRHTCDNCTYRVGGGGLRRKHQLSDCEHCQNWNKLEVKLGQMRLSHGERVCTSLFLTDLPGKGVTGTAIVSCINVMFKDLFCFVCFVGGVALFCLSEMLPNA